MLAIKSKGLGRLNSAVIDDHHNLRRGYFQLDLNHLFSFKAIVIFDGFNHRLFNRKSNGESWAITQSDVRYFFVDALNYIAPGSEIGGNDEFQSNLILAT